LKGLKCFFELIWPNITVLGYKYELKVVSDAIEQEIRREGEKLSDMLSMPVKDALGQDINTDYSEDIVNIRDVLDATVARKNIFR